MKELMRRAGDASPAAALRYRDATEDRDKAIANAFDEMLSSDVVPISKSVRSRPKKGGWSTGRGPLSWEKPRGRDSNSQPRGPPGTSVPTGHNSN